MSDLPIRDRVPQIVPAAATLPVRPVRPVTSAPAGLTGRDIVQILRRRKWLIILSTVIATFLAVVITVLWLRYSPLYTVQALLTVEVPKATELSTIQPIYGMEVIDRFKMTHARLIKIAPVLQAATEDEELRRTSWFKESDKSLAVRRLRDELTVAPISGTNFVMISMTGPKPTDLPGIVNAVAKAYVNYNQRQMTGGYAEDTARLTTERNRYETDLAAVRRNVRSQRPEDVPNIESQTSTANVAVQTHYRAYLDLEARQATMASALSVVMNMAEQGTLQNSPEVQQAVDYDPAVRTLKMTELNYITEKENIERKYGTEHPRVKDYDTRLRSIRQEMDARIGELAAAQTQAVIDGRKAAYQAISMELAQAKEKYDQAVNKLYDLQDVLSRLKQMAAQEEQLVSNIETIDRRLMDLRLLSTGERSVQIASQAANPDFPSMPRWTITVPAGFMLGLMFGLGLAFLLELIDSSIKTPSDIARKVDLPLLGMVPHADDLDEEVEDMRLAFNTNPNSLLSEAFRQIHTCLLFSGPAEQRRTVLVTSASPGDGRTTVAMNLAAAAARTGRRVLLVDTNFRQPMIHQVFSQCPASGLSSVLSSQEDWHQAFCQIDGNLHAMSAGPLPPNPAELLASPTMRRLIAEMCEQFDQVIFDGAPVMLVTDPLALSTMVDGVVLVVRAGRNTHGLVQRSRDTLNRVGARILGVVLNAVRVTPGGYLRKNYNAYYEYHELPEPVAK